MVLKVKARNANCHASCITKHDNMCLCVYDKCLHRLRLASCQLKIIKTSITRGRHSVFLPMFFTFLVARSSESGGHGVKDMVLRKCAVLQVHTRTHTHALIHSHLEAVRVIHTLTHTCSQPHDWPHLTHNPTAGSSAATSEPDLG